MQEQCLIQQEALTVDYDVKDLKYRLTVQLKLNHTILPNQLNSLINQYCHKL